jgi:hypothetical protein
VTAGLRANLDKTQAVWFGSGNGCGIEYLPDSNLLWNHSGKFKVLGIEFDLGCPNKIINNFHTKFKKVITVIKTLALPILTKSFLFYQIPPKKLS